MKIYALSDPHLSLVTDKPMDKFGGGWEGHPEKMQEGWSRLVTKEDVVLISGDISWAMTLAEAVPDLEFIGSLSGTKVLIKGNHDFWWGSISRVREKAPKSMIFLQNDAVRLGNTVICGSRSWLSPSADGFTADDRKIYDRELLRLEMSLRAGQKLLQPEDKLIVMTHYPPIYPDKPSTAVSELFEKYNVDEGVFGHVHSVKNGWEPFTVNNVKYTLASADYIGFCPILISE